MGFQMSRAFVRNADIEKPWETSWHGTKMLKNTADIEGSFRRGRSFGSRRRDLIEQNRCINRCDDACPECRDECNR